MASKNLEPVIVKPINFDINKFTVNPPEVTVFKANGHSMTTSPITYVSDTGRIGLFCPRVPKQFCFGLEEILDEKTKAVKGYQVKYFVTSQETMNNPTDEEKATMKMFDQIQKKVYESGKKFLEQDDELMAEGKKEKLPSNCRGSFLSGESMAKKNKDYISRIIKPAYSKPYKKGTKIIDELKPYQLYAKCSGFVNKSGTPVVITPFYRNGGRNKIAPIDLVTVWDNGSPVKSMRGEIDPLLYLKAVFWGGHMTQPFCGSVQIELFEANYYPSNSTLERKRAIEENEDADNYEEGGSEYNANASTHQNAEDDSPAQDDPFTKPETKNPVDILTEAVEANLKVSETKKKTKKPAPKPVQVEVEIEDDEGEEEVEEVKPIAKSAPKKKKSTKTQ